MPPSPAPWQHLRCVPKRTRGRSRERLRAARSRPDPIVARLRTGFRLSEKPIECVSPTFALGGHFRPSRQKIPFAFNVGTAKITENRLGEDLASFLSFPSLACCC